MYRFLLSRRWLGLLALAVLVAIGCVLLSRWQWHRRDQRIAYNAPIIANYDRDPLPLDSVVRADAPVPDSSTWTPVQLTGSYLPQATTLVRNRPLSGQAGFEVLVPFRAGSEVYVVNRGWVATGSDGGSPDAVPAPPTGSVTITARLRTPERPDRRDPPVGQVYRIVPGQAAADLAARSAGGFASTQVEDRFYIGLAAETPAPTTALQPLPRPEVDEGPHLSYAIQWVIFAVGALAGFVILVRRELADELAERAQTTVQAPAVTAVASQPPTAASGTARRRSRRRAGRLTDEEAEDALLDAAENSPSS